MRAFWQRIGSRKFLTALTVQVASLLALFWPGREGEFNTAAVRIAALATMLLAAVGYGSIEASVDNQAAGGSAAAPEAPPSPEAGQP